MAFKCAYCEEILDDSELASDNPEGGPICVCCSEMYETEYADGP